MRDPSGTGVYTLTSGSITAGTDTLAIQTAFGTGPAYTTSFTVPPSAAGRPPPSPTRPAPAGTQAIVVTSTPLVQAPPATFSHPTADRGDVLASLFEWNSASVARECTTVLGPVGYGGVQVAPPQDSIDNQTSNPGVVHPWWEVCQPVDYDLTSRMGNEAQFKSMVATCQRTGVKVYVDAVINHMKFPDTHYRRVTYVPSGTTRYREFFDAADLPADDDPSLAGPPVTLDMLSGSRPAAPTVLDTVPLLRWEDEAEPAQPFARRRVRR